MANKNRVLIPEARTALDRFKYEIANEVGIPDYEYADKGNLSSRENGMVGGMMVKHMIEAFEKDMARRR